MHCVLDSDPYRPWHVSIVWPIPALARKYSLTLGGLALWPWSGPHTCTFGHKSYVRPPRVCFRDPGQSLTRLGLWSWCEPHAFVPAGEFRNRQRVPAAPKLCQLSNRSSESLQTPRVTCSASPQPNRHNPESAARDLAPEAAQAPPSLAPWDEGGAAPLLRDGSDFANSNPSKRHVDGLRTRADLGRVTLETLTLRESVRLSRIPPAASSFPSERDGGRGTGEAEGEDAHTRGTPGPSADAPSPRFGIGGVPREVLDWTASHVGAVRASGGTWRGPAVPRDASGDFGARATLTPSGSRMGQNPLTPSDGRNPGSAMTEGVQLQGIVKAVIYEDAKNFYRVLQVEACPFVPLLCIQEEDVRSSPLPTCCGGLHVLGCPKTLLS